MADHELLTVLVKEMVNHPEDVSVDRTVDEMGVLLTLHVHNEDIGSVIGRQGQTAKALRTVFRVVGAKTRSALSIKIYEPEAHFRQHEDPSATGLHTEF